MRFRLLGVAAAASSALLLFLAGEPVGFGALAWVALVPLLVAVVREERPGWTLLYGLFFGLVYFGVHLSWIFLFGWMAWTALTFTLALYSSVATLVAGLTRRLPFTPLFVAGAWTAAELVRDRWPVGGFSWGSVGTTQVTVPGVRWLAGVVGVYGLTFLIVFVSSCLAVYIVRSTVAWREVAVVGLVLASFVAADLVAFGSPPRGRDLRLAVVQGGAPRPPQPDQRDRIFASHMRITRELTDDRSFDLVVWPEDAIGIGVSPGAIEAVEAVAAELQTPFLVGHSVADVESQAFLNLIRYVPADGSSTDVYQKRHPVPFGEYVPFSVLRNVVGTLQSEVPFDLRAGTRANVFNVEGVKVATPICFESVFPRDILDFARQGTELYVVSTNNASFERSYASQQHVAHARMRALETRQWIVQAALAGISGTIGPDGSLRDTTELFAEDGFVAEVRARPLQALYARIGDVFPALWSGLTGLGLLVALLRRRKGAGLESDS